ncbi:MAG: DUF47 domain-containing protein [Bacillota bacterium]
MNTIFKKSIELNKKIEDFLDVISDNLLLFEKTITFYLKEDFTNFNEKLNIINNKESQGDKLEKEIKTSLYKYMLLPNVRADVLSLIKDLDDINDYIEDITKEFYIQSPNFPENLNSLLSDIIKNTILSADELINATNSFFNEVHLVNKYINKVNFYEHEVDILEDKINKSIFRNKDLDLCEKTQLKYFISKIAKISDKAEKISDKLTIFTLKREI